MNHLRKYGEVLNEAHTEHFKYENVPNPIIDKAKEWIIANPRLARRNPEESDYFKIEVFGFRNHKKVADDLYQSLKDSGFLTKYPLFSIRLEYM